MIAFENDIFPRQIAAGPAAAQPVAGRPAVKTPTRPTGGLSAGGPQSGGFQGVFEAEVRSLPPRAGAQVRLAAKQLAANDGGFQPVFEADVLAPLPASQTGSNVPLWDNGGFGFSDVLDVINPLQHLPIISAIYRAETGDKIGAIPRVLGSMLYGGGLVGAIVGAATAAINIAVEQETGKDIGAHIYTALFGEGGKNATTTTIAATPARLAAAQAATQATAQAAAQAAPKITAAAKRKAPLAVAQPASAQAAIIPALVRAKSIPTPAIKAPANLAPVATPPVAIPSVKAGPPSNGVRVTGKEGAKTSLSVATAKAVTSQFRRSIWYRRNQDALTAQARELASTKAAMAARAAKTTGVPQATPAARSQPDMLRLFTGSAGAAAKSSTNGAKSRAATERPAAIRKAALAHEMSKALVKYEQLLKSRIAGAPKAGQLK